MNKQINLHTIAEYNGTEYELENLLNDLLYKIDQLEQKLQRKDNIINELKQNKRDYERENILEMKLHILDNNWNELKEELSDDNKFQLFYVDENINTMMTLGAKYYREYILDKIKELEN